MTDFLEHDMNGPWAVRPAGDANVQVLLDFSRRADEHTELDRIGRFVVDTAARLGAGDARLTLAPFPSGALGDSWDTAGLRTCGLVEEVIAAATQEVTRHRSPVRTVSDSDPAQSWSLLCVPVIAKTRFLGTLLVARLNVPLPDDTEQVLEILAAQAGSAIVRSLQFKAFRDITLATVEASKLQRTLESVFRKLEAMGFEFATISAVDRYRGVIETLRSMNVPPEWTRRARHSLDSLDIQADVIRARRTEVIKGPDPRFDPEIYSRFEHAKLARVFVPIVYRGQAVGTIEAGCSVGRSATVLTPSSVKVVESIATEYAKAVADARPHVLLKLIAGHTIDVLGADSASLHVYKAGREFLLAGAGKATAEFLLEFAPRSNGIGRLALQTGEPQIRDATQLSVSHTTLFTRGVQAMVAVPLLLEKSVHGVLYVHFWQPHEFSDLEIEVLKVLARHMEAAIQNAQLMRDAVEMSEDAWTFSRLQMVIQEVAAGTALSDVLGSIAQNVLTACGADNVTLYQYFEKEDRFDFPPVMKGVFWHSDAMGAQVRPGDIVSDTVRTGVSRFMSNVTREKKLAGPRTDGLDTPRFVTREGIKSSAALILRSAHKTLGVMFVNYRSKHAFTAGDQTALTALASSAAIAIASTRAAADAQQLRERVDRDAERRLAAIEAMKAVLDRVALGTRGVEQQVLDLILEKAMEIVRARVGVFMGYSSARQVLESRATRGLPASAATIQQKISEGVTGLAARTRQSVLVEDATDDKWNGVFTRVVNDTRSELAVPLVDQGGLLGVLNLEDPDPARFNEEDRALLEALANQAASAIHSVRLYQRLERQIQPLQFLGLIATRLHGDLDARLRLLLTGITARQGLGLSRAILFLLDAHQTRLEGIMAVGASSGQEAESIWHYVDQFERDAASQQSNIAQSLLDETERRSADIRSGRIADSILSTRVRRLGLPLNEHGSAVVQCVREGRLKIVNSDEDDPLRDLLPDDPPGDGRRPRAFACIPISTDGRAVGTIVVDNAFLESESDLDLEIVRSVEAFAEMAGLTIGQFRLEGLKQWRTFMRGTGHLFGSHIAVIGALVGKLRATMANDEFADLRGGIAQMQRLLADFGRFTEAPTFEKLELGHLVKATVGALKASVSVSIELTIGARPIDVFGDRRLLSVVVSELIENAEEAMRHADAPTRLITVRVRVEGRADSYPMALIEVCDTGPGIPREHVQDIFRPLFTTKARGSGLGLMVVWDIVEQHKGSIVAEEGNDAGARFVVRLPLIPDSERI